MSDNACEYSDPSLEVKMVVDEVVEWLSGIIRRHMNAIAKREDGAAAIGEILAGFKLDIGKIEGAAEASALSLSRIAWSEDETRVFARNLLMMSKPFVVAANKSDLVGEKEIDELREKLGGYEMIACSAAIELALRKAAKAGVINYVPGSKDFEIVGSASEEQRKALGYMKGYISRGGTGINELFEKLVFGVLKMVVVYPVEDENKFTDHFGNVLPDAILVKDGSTALELAAKIHTDLARNMLYAIDAKRKTRLAKEYVLKDNDVIRIVSAAKH
jgi:ribosome-binding ATPase YchF (GTP1/OBG family)